MSKVSDGIFSGGELQIDPTTTEICYEQITCSSALRQFSFVCVYTCVAIATVLFIFLHIS